MEVIFGLAVLYLWRKDLKEWCSDTLALGIKKAETLELPEKDEEVK